MKTTATKLHKIGEYGHGSTTLIIGSSRSFEGHHHIDLINRLDKTPKVFLYNLDFDRDDDFINLINELTNTLNKFYFAKTIVVDYPVFALMDYHSHKLSVLKDGLEKIVIINPSNKKSAYTNLFGEKISLPDLKNRPESIHHEFNSSKKEIIALDDTKYAISIASKLKNSRLYKSGSYKEMLDNLVKLISI